MRANFFPLNPISLLRSKVVAFFAFLALHDKTFFLAILQTLLDLIVFLQVFKARVNLTAFLLFLALHKAVMVFFLESNVTFLHELKPVRALAVFLPPLPAGFPSAFSNDSTWRVRTQIKHKTKVVRG